MTWNYRVMRHEQKAADVEEITYHFHEVHYNEDDSVRSWTQEPCAPMGETLEELSGDIAWFIAALAKPILDAKTGKIVEPAVKLADELYKMLFDEKAKAGLAS